jgi:hypothetical protein
MTEGSEDGSVGGVDPRVEAAPRETGTRQIRTGRVLTLWPAAIR